MTASDATLAELSDIRGRIDTLDAILVHTLVERFRQTARVGRLKADHALPAFDPGREEAQLERLASLAAGVGLDPGLACDILGLVTDRVKDNHRKISGEQ